MSSIKLKLFLKQRVHSTGLEFCRSLCDLFKQMKPFPRPLLMPFAQRSSKRQTPDTLSSTKLTMFL